MGGSMYSAQSGFKRGVWVGAFTLAFRKLMDHDHKGR